MPHHNRYVLLWLHVARTAANNARRDKVTLIASGVAFRTSLAIFPAIGLLIWLAGHFMGPDQVDAALQSAAAALPASTRDIIGQAADNQSAGLNGVGGAWNFGIIGPLLSLLFTLWSANSGVKALFVGLNSVFDRTEGRSFPRLLLITIVFTIGSLAVTLLGIGLIAIGPQLLSLIGAAEIWLIASEYVRWPLFFIVSVGCLSALYRAAPNSDRRSRRFVTVGGIAASLALTGTSAAFSWSIQHVMGLSITYGSLSTFIAFMIWLWLMFTLVLAGAELDAAISQEAAESPQGRAEEAKGPPSHRAKS